jgi:hypothetical protein
MKKPIRQSLTVPVKEPAARVHITLSPPRMTKLAQLCAATGRGPSDVVGMLIDQAEGPDA